MERDNGAVQTCMKNLGMAGLILLIGAMAGLLAGCTNDRPQPKPQVSVKNVVRIGGSTAMEDMAKEWARAYKDVASQVRVEVSATGTEEGIVGLVQGTWDIANASRELTSAEVEKIIKETGKYPNQYVVDTDDVALCVHKDNPLKEISLEQIREIYGANGGITNWSQLGVKAPNCEQNAIALLGRNPEAGSREFLQLHALGTNVFKPAAAEFTNSTELIAAVARTPCGIGYAGSGFMNAEVKTLKVSNRKGEAAFEPTMENIMARRYPLGQRLSFYTLGDLRPEVQKFVDWCLANSSVTNRLKQMGTPW